MLTTRFQTESLARFNHILVDFGDSYTGESFFPNDPSKKGWFPVCLFKNLAFTADRISSDGFEQHSHAQIPLKLYWAWIAHKCQGITIKGKVVIDLCSHELQHSILHIALSWVTKFANIGLKKGITMSSLCQSIKNKKSKGQIGYLNLLRERTIINFNQ